MKCSRSALTTKANAPQVPLFMRSSMIELLGRVKNACSTFDLITPITKLALQYIYFAQQLFLTVGGRKTITCQMLVPFGTALVLLDSWSSKKWRAGQQEQQQGRMRDSICIEIGCIFHPGGLDSEVVDLQLLSEDWKKLATCTYGCRDSCRTRAGIPVSWHCCISSL